MRTAVIVDAVRSPMGKGKAGGAFSTLHPVELLAQTLQGLVARSDLDPGIVDDVIVGCVSQAGEQSNTPGRMAWLAAGFPEHVPSTTIERKCGSSQQSLHFAAQGIMADVYDIVIVAGIESMSRVPMGSARMGQDPFGPSLAKRYPDGLVPQGVSAELVAAKWGITRDALDEYAAASHERAAGIAESGGFDKEITPITVEGEEGTVTVTRDETIRPGTTAERLSQLRPAFEDEGMSKRFPQISWSITAGNSSQITDGASALLVMSEEKASALGLRPRACVFGFAVVGDDPIMMLTGPIPATRMALERSKMDIGDIDHFEVNEAFVSVPLAWQAELGVDGAKLNPRGGAIALGHPLGASGARLMTTMLTGLEATNGRYGLQTMCEAGGMANATIIERL